MKAGEVLNREAPRMYREMAKKLYERHGERVSRSQAKDTLGLCFKIGKYKKVVLNELVDFGLLIFANKQTFFVNYMELEDVD